MIFSSSLLADSYVGKLITNVQENDGNNSSFILMTKDGSLKIKLENEKFLRPLFKLSGEVIIVTGSLENQDNDALDIDLDDEPIFAARTSVPTIPNDGDFEFPSFDEFNEDTVLKIDQYTVAVNEKEISGVIRNDWVDGREMYFIKDNTGIDHPVIVLEDVQNDFYEKYEQKNVFVLGCYVIVNSKKQFVVKNITLK